VATTTRDQLVCECGHEGHLSCKETDQPYGGLWESYRLEGFEGRGLVITNYKDMPKDLLAHLNPKCPACGQTGKVKYANRT
jgi:hypothetical protein